MIAMFESAILGELAHVLDVARSVLAAELHGIHPVFSGSAPARPPEAPLQRPSPPSPIELRGYEYLGEFQVTAGTLAIGEWTASSADRPADVKVRTNLLVGGLTGGWHAFLEGDDEIDALIAVHRDHVADFNRLRKDARDVGRVVVEGGAMTILDAAVRDDPAFIDEIMFPLFTDGLILDRGCHCRTGGDGVFPVRGTFEGNALVFAAVRFDE